MIKRFAINASRGKQAFLSQIGIESPTSFRFRLYYVRRREAWYLRIESADGTPLVSGVRIVSDFPLIDQYRQALGNIDTDLLVMDLTSSGIEPTRDGLGEDYVFIETDEF